MGDGLPDTERIADRQHHIADLQRIGIAEFDGGKALLHVQQSQHREIGARILQHDLGFELALVGQRDLDFARAVDDVIIRHHHPAGVDNHA